MQWWKSWNPQKLYLIKERLCQQGLRSLKLFSAITYNISINRTYAVELKTTENPYSPATIIVTDLFILCFAFNLIDLSGKTTRYITIYSDWGVLMLLWSYMGAYEYVVLSSHFLASSFHVLIKSIIFSLISLILQSEFIHIP
jgi:hypothetical protein